MYRFDTCLVGTPAQGDLVKYVVLDFETASRCDLLKCGAWRYAEDPSTEVICLCWSIDGGEVRTWQPGDDKTELMEIVRDDKVILIAHGAQFEKAIWRAIMAPEFGFPDVPNSRWHCTLAACALHSIPLRLDRAALVLRLPFQKDTEGSAVARSLSKTKRGYFNRSASVIERTVTYCVRDVQTETSLHHRLGWLPPGERYVWLLDQRINERGVRIDIPFVDRAQEVVDRASAPLVAEFRELTGVNPTQRDKFLQWCTEQGVDVPDLKKQTVDYLLGEDDGLDGDDEHSDDDLLYDFSRDDGPPRGDTVPLPGSVRRALGIRKLVGSASVKKLQRMKLCTCADGRARGLLQYRAGITGRWGGRIIQPQNFPILQIITDDDHPLDPELLVGPIMTGDPDYVEAVIGDPIPTVVAALRHALVPAHDRVFVSGDYKGVEARILLALSGQHDKAALMASGASPYCDMAEKIYGYVVTKKANPVEYDIGKHCVLGLGYGMGWWTFGQRYAREAEEDFLKKVVHTYRKEWAPCVPKFWYALEEAAAAAVWDNKPRSAYGVTYRLDGEWLTARLPSGGMIWYYGPKKTRRGMPWDPTDIRPSWSYHAQRKGQWCEIQAFGGLLTGQTIQAIARDLLVGATFRLEKNGFPICLTCHDEDLAEPKREDADEAAFQQIMLDNPAWVGQLKIPLAVDTWKGDRYRK